MEVYGWIGYLEQQYWKNKQINEILFFYAVFFHPFRRRRRHRTFQCLLVVVTVVVMHDACFLETRVPVRRRS